MAELITAESLAPILDELRLAYRVRITKEDSMPTVRVWLDALHGLTADAVRTAARRCMQTGEHFPRIKEVRELALDFMARTHATMPARRDVNPFACPICGAEPVPIMRTRDGQEIQVRTEVYHDPAAHHVVDTLT